MNSGALRGMDILCFSSIDWDFIWQGHQQIMSELAAQGSRVLFVENTGVRRAGWRDAQRLRRRLINWWRSTKGFRQVQDNLFVYSPVILPFPYARLARWINRGLLFGALRRWMRATGFHRPILWTFLPTPIVREAMREFEPEVTIYYCIDDLASSSAEAARIRASEEYLFQEANLVFVTSEKLRQRAACFADRVHLFPFGVDFERFKQVRQEPDGVPEDLRALPRPIIGYVGGLHQWLDQDLLTAIAAQMPQASVALVGPAQTDVSRLAASPNIHLLQARPHNEVPRYLKGFDVGIIPYRLSEYTAHVYPTKLNEYLAMGMPVVATDLPEIRRFNAEQGRVVAVARNAEEFVGAIREALAEQGTAAAARRIVAAQDNSWTARIARMSALIHEQLGISRAEAHGWQVRLRRLYHRAQRQALRLVGSLLILYVVLFHSSVPWMIAEPLRVAAPPHPADAIVVFAGGVGESGKAGGGYQERVKHAVDLYRQGWAPRMIFSSGYTFVFQEADVMRQLALELGVPPDAIALETTARNTYQNVAHTRRILSEHHWRSVLLVSSPYHMRRALLAWKQLAPEIDVVPTPVPDSQFYTHGRNASLEQLVGLLHEYAGLVYYWWRRGAE